MRDEDALIATDGASARSRVQSADIMLGELREGEQGGIPWLNGIFAGYPGCMVAVARHDEGQWCVLAARDGTVVLARADREPLTREATGSLARVLYRRAVLCEPMDLLAALHAASPVPIRLTPWPGAHGRPAGDGGEPL